MMREVMKVCRIMASAAGGDANIIIYQVMVPAKGRKAPPRHLMCETTAAEPGRRDKL